MAFVLVWTAQARSDYDGLKAKAKAAKGKRQGQKKGKASKAEGMFNQVVKTLTLLADKPKHSGLQAHEYDSLAHPYDPGQKVWEAYVQNDTPGAYRLFWCYGPDRGKITVIAITPHP